ncbi:enoyl-CoA hydratase/isomerase family protein [Aliihoeflea sp. PC F10.4]
MSQYETVDYRVEDRVAVIAINRPARMNTLGAALKADLRELFTNVMVKDEAIRCVVMTAVGEKAFCAGADVKEYSDRVQTPYGYFATQRATLSLFREIETFERPVIAALNGVALGGGLELAMCADLIIAAEHARLGLPESNLGAMPAAGGTQRLPRRIGMAKAKELMFTGRLIDAGEALDIGLINKVCSAGELMETAMGLAREIAARAPISMAFIKHAVNAGSELCLDEAMEIERLASTVVMNSADRKEGMKAFLEKRRPQFVGE